MKEKIISQTLAGKTGVVIGVFRIKGARYRCLRRAFWLTRLMNHIENGQVDPFPHLYQVASSNGNPTPGYSEIGGLIPEK